MKFPQHINPRAEPGSGQAPAGASGFMGMGMGGLPGRRGAEMSPEGMAHAVMRQGQQGQQTAEKVRRDANWIHGLAVVCGLRCPLCKQRMGVDGRGVHQAMFARLQH
jgi:hypothetical protein